MQRSYEQRTNFESFQFSSQIKIALKALSDESHGQSKDFEGQEDFFFFTQHAVVKARKAFSSDR